MASKTEKQTLGDVLLWETDPRFCREEVVLNNNTGGDYTFEAGLITEISSGEHVPVSTPANAAGIVLRAEGAELADAGEEAGLVLVEGPALVKKQALDFNGAAEPATIAALAAIGIKIIDGPSVETDHAA